MDQRGSLCRDCYQKCTLAESFRRQHVSIPRRYREATSERKLKLGTGILFLGEPGTGKTWESYGLLMGLVQADPRLTAAAYSWASVLLQLRRGYSDETAATQANAILDALRDADVVFLDDLGAEKVTESNLAWLQENLYVILDHRYNWVKTTILTANLTPAQLPEYLGPRLSSRVLGMCAPVEMKGQDRRLG